MNTETTNSHNRQVAIRALAVVGFIALIFIGMTLAIYTARYIPAAVSGIGQAAVSLSSVFTPAKSTLEVVNTGTVVPFGTPVATTTATTTVVTTTDTTDTTSTVTIPSNTTTTTHIVTQPNPGASSETAYVIPGGTNTNTTTGYTGTLYGQPDLAIVNMTAGYLPLNNSTDADFVASQNVPAGTRFAVKFTVINQGTNASGNWDFSAQLPTKQSYVFYAPSQQSLNPGDKLDLMLHLDQGQAATGNQTALVTIDPNHNVGESNENNNFGSVSASISQ